MCGAGCGYGLMIWHYRSNAMLIGFFIFTKISLYPLLRIMKDSRLQLLTPTVGITSTFGLTSKNG